MKGHTLRDDYDLGSCCICEGSKNVRNIIQLGYKVQSETAWGCVVCRLPAEGAVAAVCDACLDRHAVEDIEPHIRFLMDSPERRIPIVPEPERILHEHDIRYHKHEMYTC